MGNTYVSSFDLQLALITPITPPSVASGATATRPALAMPDPVKTRLRDISRRVIATAMQTESADPTKTPNVIQGYFLILSNTGSQPVENAFLRFITTTPNPLISSPAPALAFVDSGNEQNQPQTFIETFGGDAQVNLDPIPANGSVIFALIPNYTISNNVVDVRGSVLIGAPTGTELLLTPETRSVFGNPQPPSVSETAYALPTTSGGSFFQF